MIHRQLMLFFRVFIGLAILLPVATHAQAQSTSRENPAPFGEVVEVSDYEVRVISTTPDAENIVMEENSYNVPPEPGQQFYLVRLELTYIGSDTGDPFWDLVYGSVGTTGMDYNDSSNSCGVYPDSPHDVGEMFPGAVTELNICWAIDADDADSLVMFVRELAAPSDTNVWLSLSDGEPDSTPVADSDAEQPRRSRTARPGDSTPAASRTSRGGSSTTPQSSGSDIETARENAAPFGESVTIGDYEVRVISTTPDAENIVMEENSYNVPPEPGQQFYLVRLELTYIGSDTGDPFWDLVYGSVGTTGMDYTDFGNSCGVYPDSLHDVGEMFPGASTELNICWAIDADDADSLVMFVRELAAPSDTSVWLNLEP